VDYLELLRRLHSTLMPRRYLEIGVRWGHSLGAARCPSIGIDPAFNINTELHTEVHIFRTTSDEYFAREDPLAPVQGEPFDLAFIDGMHLFEFALRDFINAERFSRPGGLVVFDDVLPRNTHEAARVRITSAWTGDVFRILEVLARYRPEILAIPLNTTPTGLMVLLGLDPTSTVLADSYDEIVSEFRQRDPQLVPPAILERAFVQEPQRFLDSGLLEILAAAPDDVDQVELAKQLRSRAAEALGAAYGQGATVGV
jgi:SAM-dependent methyltransferase